jgi:hypothetical protein
MSSSRLKKKNNITPRMSFTVLLERKINPGVAGRRG